MFSKLSKPISFSREPLPEEIQKIVDLQEKEAQTQTIEVKALPFEPKSSKKKANG